MNSWKWPLLLSIIYPKILLGHSSSWKTKTCNVPKNESRIWPLLERQESGMSATIDTAEQWMKDWRHFSYCSSTNIKLLQSLILVQILWQPRKFWAARNVETSQWLGFQIKQGRQTMLLQFLKFRTARTINQTSESGSFWDNCTLQVKNWKINHIFSKLRKFSDFLAPGKDKIFKEFISSFLGRVLRFFLCFKFNTTSLLCCAIDGWISVRLMQHLRHNLSRFGIPINSGVLIRSLDWLKINGLYLV